MRVITGTARGRRLGELKGSATRPTTDKVKEAMFSAIQFQVQGARVLDLFAGTGQLGIEALSRGAQSAVFVDSRREAVQLVRDNLALTRLEANAQVVCGDALGYLAGTAQRFDLIFLDPPYAAELLTQALARIMQDDLVSPGGFIVAESAHDKLLPAPLPPYCVQREYHYGSIKVTLFHREEAQQT